MAEAEQATFCTRVVDCKRVGDRRHEGETVYDTEYRFLYNIKKSVLPRGNLFYMYL